MTLLKIIAGIVGGCMLALLCWKFAEVYVKYALGGNDYAHKD